MAKSTAQRTLDIITEKAAGDYDNTASEAMAAHLEIAATHCAVIAAVIFKQPWKEVFVGEDAASKCVTYASTLGQDHTIYIKKVLWPSMTLCTALARDALFFCSSTYIDRSTAFFGRVHLRCLSGP